MHTLIIIAIFIAIILAPVLAAQAARAKKRKHDSSGAIPAWKVQDPAAPAVIHHLRPKPRRRKF